MNSSNSNSQKSKHVGQVQTEIHVFEQNSAGENSLTRVTCRLRMIYSKALYDKTGITANQCRHTPDF